MLKEYNSDYNKEWTYAVFNHGYLEEWYFIDDSTGNKSHIGRDISQHSNVIKDKVWLTLNTFAYKQTMTCPISKKILNYESQRIRGI